MPITSSSDSDADDADVAIYDYVADGSHVNDITCC
jgi:hypothetical protein